jgi:hypothetical protein
LFMVDDLSKKPEQLQIAINLDTTPILFTDSINMTTNADGVVLDVMQRLGNTNQVRIVSRIGMSRDHAKKFVDSLGKLLLRTDGVVATGDKAPN